MAHLCVLESLLNSRTKRLYWQASQVVVQQPEQVGLLLVVLRVPLGVVRARVVRQLHLERSIQRRLARCACEGRCGLRQRTER